MRAYLRRGLAVIASAVALMGAVSVVAPAQPAPTPPTVLEPAAPVIDEDFSDGELPEGWNPTDGQWSVQDGRLVVVADGISRLTFGEHLENYRFEATVRFEQVANNTRWMSLILDIPEAGGEPWWQVAMRSQSTLGSGLEIAHRHDGTWSVPHTGAAPTDAGVGTDVRLRVDVRGTKATYYFNGHQILSGTIDRSADGILGLAADHATVSFDDIIVTELTSGSTDDNELLRQPGEMPIAIAHRGYSSILPENTRLAEVAAMKLGAEYFEIDVHTTADGVPVVLHDDTLDRTTDGSGLLALTDSAVVAGLDAGSWKDPIFHREHVPTLEEILVAQQGNQGKLMMEIKGTQSREQVYRMLDLVKEYELLDRVAVESFNFAVVGYARDWAANHDVEIPLGLLSGTVSVDPVADARAYGATMYNPSHSGGLTRAIVDDLHEAGIAVAPYTIDDPQRWAELTEMGVDGIVTNKPGIYLGWRQALQSAQQVAEPVAPTVDLVGITDGQEFTTGDQIPVAATSGDASRVIYRLDDQVVEVGTLRAADLGPGEYTLVATASSGVGVVRDTVTFRIVDEPGPTPTPSPTPDEDDPDDDNEGNDDFQGQQAVTVTPDRVAQGAEVTFRATGFAPGEHVTFTVHSQTITLPAVVADGNGVATVTWQVPTDFTVGTHTVTASGDSGTASAPFSVHPADLGPWPGGLPDTGSIR